MQTATRLRQACTCRQMMASAPCKSLSSTSRAACHLLTAAPSSCASSVLSSHLTDAQEVNPLFFVEHSCMRNMAHEPEVYCTSYVYLHAVLYLRQGSEMILLKATDSSTAHSSAIQPEQMHWHHQKAKCQQSRLARQNASLVFCIWCQQHPWCKPNANQLWMKHPLHMPAI